jgi:hypothetical protein
MEQIPYATDLSDEQWALIEPLVTARQQERVARSATGDPGSCDLLRGRERAALPEPDGLSAAAPATRPPSLVGGVPLLYPVAPGRPRPADPGDPALPGAGAVQTIGGPSLVIDTRSVRVAAGVPKETTGLDANKKTPGRLFVTHGLMVRQAWRDQGVGRLHRDARSMPRRP